MPIAPSRFFVGPAQAVERVLTYRLQHSIASRSLVLLGENEVLVRQGCEQADGVRFLDSVARAGMLCSRQRPATGEDRQPMQHRLLDVGEQVVTPVDRRP